MVRKLGICQSNRTAKRKTVNSSQTGQAACLCVYDTHSCVRSTGCLSYHVTQWQQIRMQREKESELIITPNWLGLEQTCEYLLLHWPPLKSVKKKKKKMLSPFPLIPTEQWDVVLCNVCKRYLCSVLWQYVCLCLQMADLTFSSVWCKSTGYLIQRFAVITKKDEVTLNPSIHEGWVMLASLMSWCKYWKKEASI